MRIAICWTEISGYMASCWRTLAARADVDLLVVAWRAGDPQPFGDEVMAGVRHQLFPRDQRDAPTTVAAVREFVTAHRPDVLIIPGWGVPAYTALASDPALAAARLVVTLDTPWTGSWRQRLARLKVRRLMDRASAVLVPGERSRVFAERVGVARSKIVAGLYSCDVAALAACLERRAAGPWPREFLYMGRYVPEKGLDVLLAAYRAYRAAAADPWGLRCHGAGPLKAMLAGEPGVIDGGFVQPADQPGVLERAGASVLASRHEPWGVAVLEAAAAGLPVICTDACGAGVELVRPYYNGLVTAAGDAAGLTRALTWVHANEARLPVMGQRGRELAGAYDATVWAERIVELGK